ncbi:MAG: 2Fe-2S iron-sulfur cluster binding domain-containing protein [Nocardioidaceae bacterium]|nr:2Fe-2S iron-sulfur cluster binding domain-containing protein [Nocardioidaceae bacterium]
MPLVAPQTWLPVVDEPLVCVDVRPVTHDVRTFVLRHPRGGRFVFEPGQHVTLTADLDTGPVERCYTIASPPTAPGTLELTVKRVPGGPVSGWLHDTVRAGTMLQVSGPYGVFTTSRHPAAKHLYLSAGSGITPLMSMTRDRRDRGDGADVVLVHNARTPDDIVFRAELQHLAEQVPGVRVVTICEADSAAETWTGPRGRLTLAHLLAAAPDLLEREVFTCGPAPYMAAARTLLAEAGADPARCHEESFDLGTPGPPPDDGPPAGPTYTVELRRSGRTLECGAGTSILGAAARAGLSLPSSCGEGVCGTCRSTLLEGTVDMEPAGGIRPREIAQQRILLCCATPTSDLVVDA